MKNFIIALSFSLFLLACKAAPTIRYTPTLNGEEDPQGMLPAGQPLQPVEINWYGVLFYTGLITWAIWFYFRNEGGDDMNHDGIQDSSEVNSTMKSHADGKSINDVGDGTPK